MASAGTEKSAPAGGITRRPGKLSDGREIIWYDESPDADREVHDSRDLAPVQPASRVRWDALRGEWVDIADHRQTRTYQPAATDCPLCPSTPGHASEIPSDDYDVVVFENRFPAFDGLGPIGGPELFGTAPGHGRCEVLCYTPEHDATFSQLSPTRVRTVLEAQVDRTRELSALPGVEQVFCFENRGVEIGVTLTHPHGQVYGYPFVTPITATVLRNVRDHRRQTGRNLFEDLLAVEIADGSRMVAQNEHWVAFVPFAARWPVEVHLYPRVRVPDLTALGEAPKAALPDLWLEVLARMEGLFDDTLPAITGWHQAPVHTGREDFWLHLELFSIRRAVGKLKYLAGSESAMGAFINDTSPEAIATRLREVTPA